MRTIDRKPDATLRGTGPNRLHQGVVAGARTVYVAETYAPLHEQVDTLHIPRAYTRSTVFAKASRDSTIGHSPDELLMSCVDRHTVTVTVTVIGLLVRVMAMQWQWRYSYKTS